MEHYNCDDDYGKADKSKYDNDAMVRDKSKNFDRKKDDEFCDGINNTQKSDNKMLAAYGQDDEEEGNAANEVRLVVRTLWKTGLEVFIHQLLYRRGIYPRDSFCSTRFVGAECKIHSNPGVLYYIAEALKDIIPAIFGDGEKGENHGCRRLKELLIEIYDQATGITYEQFSLRFLSPSNEEGNTHDDIKLTGLHSSFSNSVSYCDPKSDLPNYVVEEVEKELRDLVCSTGNLERPRSLVWADSVSFKIKLKMNQRTNREVTTLAGSGLGADRWSKTTSASSCQTGSRILFNISNFACQFQYRLISSKDKMKKSLIMQPKLVCDE